MLNSTERAIGHAEYIRKRIIGRLILEEQIQFYEIFSFTQRKEIFREVINPNSFSLFTI